MEIKGKITDELNILDALSNYDEQNSISFTNDKCILKLRVTVDEPYYSELKKIIDRLKFKGYSNSEIEKCIFNGTEIKLNMFFNEERIVNDKIRILDRQIKKLDDKKKEIIGIWMGIEKKENDEK